MDQVYSYDDDGIDDDDVLKQYHRASTIRRIYCKRMHVMGEDVRAFFFFLPWIMACANLLSRKGVYPTYIEAKLARA